MRDHYGREYSLRLRLASGGEAVEAVVDASAGELAAGLPPGHDAHEAVGVQQAQIHLGDGPHRGRTGNPAQQRDLADQIAGPDGGDRTPVAEDLCGSVLDDQAPVSGVTLLVEDLTGRHVPGS